MTRIELDLTDSKRFETNITKTGNIIGVELITDSGRVELILDMCDFVELVKQGSLMVNKKVSA